MENPRAAGLGVFVFQPAPNNWISDGLTDDARLPQGCGRLVAIRLSAVGWLQIKRDGKRRLFN
jgi:hypothetical protein